MSEIEQILTVPRAAFDAAGPFQGFQAENEAYRKAFFAPGVAKFLPRPEAELDPSHKQLIPYCILTHKGKILRYRRGAKGGEKRLAEKFSIGIGGHINPIDTAGAAFDESAYKNAVLRELNEELVIKAKILDRRIAGLINDDSNPVGRVHLGVVETFDLDSDVVLSNEAAIEEPEFLTIEELSGEQDTLETWSQIALEAIEEILPFQSFHFDCGNSNKGPIGFCGRIKARSKSEALSNMQQCLPDRIDVRRSMGEEREELGVEYLNIYINPGNVTMNDIGDGEPVDDDDED